MNIFCIFEINTAL